MNLQGDLRHIWYGHDEKSIFQFSFKRFLISLEEREVLGEILELAVPLLTGPLYIGVSKDLQQRLQRHTQPYPKIIAKNIRTHTALLSVLLTVKILCENDENFAQRIVERKIDPNHLVVSVVYMCRIHIFQPREFVKRLGPLKPY